MTRSAIWTGLMGGVCALVASGAWAQSTTDESAQSGSEFARDRNVSVRERPRPGYEAIGIHAGGFSIFPRTTFDAAYDDNIYATQNSPTADGIFRISPEVAIKSNWSRHELDFLAHAVFNRYVNHTSEDVTTYGVAASGRLDVLRSSNLFAGASFDRAEEPRTSPNAPAATKTPIKYNLTQADVGGVREFDRLRLSGRADLVDYNYFNTLTQGGAFLLQDDRDRREWSENGRIEFAMSPAMSFFASGTANQRRYRLRAPAAAFDRDSDGYNIGGGTSFDITRLIRGEVQVGYMRQSYKSPGFNDTSGLSYSGAVDWFPTELTTVNISGARSIQEATSINASGYISTSVVLRVDHELLRNVLLTAQGSFEQDVYQQADRTDKRPTAGFSATYLMNPHVGLRLAYDFQKLDSTGTAKTVSYNDNRLTGSLTLQF